MRDSPSIQHTCAHRTRFVKQSDVIPLSYCHRHQNGGTCSRGRGPVHVAPLLTAGRRWRWDLDSFTGQWRLLRQVQSSRGPRGHRCSRRKNFRPIRMRRRRRRDSAATTTTMMAVLGVDRSPRPTRPGVRAFVVACRHRSPPVSTAARSECVLRAPLCPSR